MVATLIACETCRPADAEGRSAGERLIAELRAAREAGIGQDVRLETVRCLWACQRSCAVHLRSPGWPGYVLVEFEPTRDAARALLEYAALYAQSEAGAVPYKTWPAGVKGHFLCRLPAAPNETIQPLGEENA